MTFRQFVTAATVIVVVLLGAGAAFGERFYQCGYDGYCGSDQRAPAASTGDVSPVSASATEVIGTVIPSNLTTTYAVRYDSASSLWCTSAGASGAPAHTTVSQTLAQSDGYARRVLVTLTGLTNGAAYCAAVTASNAKGDDQGAVVPFTAGVSATTDRQGYPTGATSATLTGEVNPAGQSTTLRVEFDSARSSWCTSAGASGSPSHETSPSALGSTATREQPVTVDVTGLASGARYCGRIVATNAGGSDHGGEPVAFFAGVGAQTESAYPSGASTATVWGEVNPVGRSTTYAAVYDTAASTWCTSEGTTGTPSYTTTPRTASGRSARSEPVKVALSGLTAGMRYCVAIKATNSTGSAVGTPQRSLTAGAPGASTYYAEATGATSALVHGGVSPNGQETHYRVGYDLEDSAWCRDDGASGSPAHLTSPVVLPGSAGDDQAVESDIDGLTPGASYCAAIIAENGSGATMSSPVTFKPAGLYVYTSSASFLDATSATVTGWIQDFGGPTTYHAEYDSVASEWCTSRGTSGSAAHSTASVALPSGAGGGQAVTVTITGVSSSQQYCAAIVATNGSGTTRGLPPVRLLPDGTAGGAPFLYMKSPGMLDASSVRVTARINPNGATTSYKAQWAAADSTWCKSAGSSGSPLGTSPTSTLPPLRRWAHWEYGSVVLSGLTSGKQYCATITASNASGSVPASEPSTFTVGLPSAQTWGVVPTGPGAVSVSGYVDTAGQASTYRAAYDVSTSVWCQSNGRAGLPAHRTAPKNLPASTSSQSVTIDVTGLTVGEGYCVGLVAANGSGESPPMYLPEVVSGRASVQTRALRASGATTAVLDGSINPASQSTTYRVRYDTATSEWCQAGGQSGAAAHETAVQPLPAVDGDEHEVSVTLTGLTPGTEYCAGLVAANGAGEVTAWPLRLVAGAPEAELDSVVPDGTTAAKVRGRIRPAGQSTTYTAVYDAADSTWCQSGGWRGTPTRQTDAQPLTDTDTATHDVEVDVTGLTAGASYCVALRAVNGSATTTTYPWTITLGGSPPGPTPPAIVAAPSVRGIATQGETLHVTRGTWSNGPATYGHQWLRCDASGSSCAPIAGSTGSAYMLTSSDVGHTIRVSETAFNAAGPGVASVSDATGVVQGVGSPGPTQSGGEPKGGGSITTPSGGAPSTTGGGSSGVGSSSSFAGGSQGAGASDAEVKAALAELLLPMGKSAKIAALLKSGYEFTFDAPEAGELTITWYYLPKGAKVAKAKKTVNPIKIATAKRTATGPGKTKVKIKLTKAGKKKLKRAKRLKLTSKVTYTPAGHEPVSRVKAFTVKR